MIIKERTMKRANNGWDFPFSRRGWAFVVVALAIRAFLGATPSPQDPTPVARWAFDDGAAARSALDAATGVRDAIEGHFKFVPGISGTGLRFDGYTTCVIRKGNKAPRLGEAFTIEAWVAPAALP